MMNEQKLDTTPLGEKEGIEMNLFRIIFALVGAACAVILYRR